jgi:hypothetical protein
MPTIHSGQYANMKIDTGKYRVWVDRGDNSVSIEELIDGSWKEVERFG